MKIARVTSIFQEGVLSDLGNYRPISALCVFSRIMKELMYNLPCKPLLNITILFEFQEDHSTDHAIIQLVYQINNSFGKIYFYLWCIYGFGKTFDTVYNCSSR